MNNKSKKGFTLVEIMIVVVIIGLLAAMAIPAFNKIRESASDKAVTNDARQLAGAAQQYFMDNPDAMTIDLDIADNGEVNNDELEEYVTKVSKGVTAGTDGELSQDPADANSGFQLQYRGVEYTFDDEGKYLSDNRS